MKGSTVALASLLVGIAVATLSHHAERTLASAWARPALRQISASDVSFIHTPAGHQSCLERGVFGHPSESLYALPYPVGRTYQVLQSCCSTTPGRSHYGLLAYDFTMEMGSEVVAARDGVVWIVRDIFPDDGISSPNDNNIYIVHLDGQTSLYVHLQRGSPLVKPGDEVVAGQVIARAGSSGTWVPCPACAVLHFEVFPRMAYEPWRDLPVNFRNAGGPLNERGTLIEGVPYIYCASLLSEDPTPVPRGLEQGCWVVPPVTRSLVRVKHRLPSYLQLSGDPIREAVRARTARGWPSQFPGERA